MSICASSRIPWHAERYEGTDFECVKEDLSGPLLLAFSKEEPGAAARVVKGFAKDNEHLVAKLVSIGGKLLPGSELDRLATLPTREQALSMLLSAMQAPDRQICAHAE